MVTSITEFEDQFEGSYFAPWDAQGVSGTTSSFSNAQAHHGSQSHLVAGLGTGQYGYVHENITSRTEYYMRGYVRISALGVADGGAYFLGPMFANSSGTTQCAGYIYRSGANYGWGVSHRTTGGHQRHDASTETINANQWYCLEIHQVIDGSAGIVELWVDGVSKVSVSSLDTDDYGNIARCESACWNFVGSMASEIDIYADCMVCDVSRVNCESAVSIPVMMHHYNHHINKIIRG